MQIKKDYVDLYDSGTCQLMASWISDHLNAIVHPLNHDVLMKGINMLAFKISINPYWKGTYNGEQEHFK